MFFFTAAVVASELPVVACSVAAVVVSEPAVVASSAAAVVACPAAAVLISGFPVVVSPAMVVVASEFPVFFLQKEEPIHQNITFRKCRRGSDVAVTFKGFCD